MLGRAAAELSCGDSRGIDDRDDAHGSPRETLYRIGQKYHVGLDQLRKWNNMSNNTVVVPDKSWWSVSQCSLTSRRSTSVLYGEADLFIDPGRVSWSRDGRQPDSVYRKFWRTSETPVSRSPKIDQGPTAYLLESVAGGKIGRAIPSWEAALQPCFMKKRRFDSDPREETPQDSEPGQPAGTCARVDGGISAGDGARPAPVCRRRSRVLEL